MFKEPERKRGSLHSLRPDRDAPGDFDNAW